ncbi:MAG: PQQ-dependent dehydrogenase, methanol/ethanol family, partial [Caulobacterales bacterium]|nr:PQQ-dependent dehydrogenase, methanol/ethanol family [Caulobacterales bacterium]
RPRGQAAAVDGARISAADAEPGQWMSHGRTYDEQRFSPLDEINTETISDLRLAWYLDLDTRRGQAATPIIVDGVMYISTAWSKVRAVDAATGQVRWAFNPEVPGAWAARACCDVINRGVAVWEGKVFVGTIDGRLIALDARSGDVVWEIDTIDRSQPYSITGAPRAAKGLVFIGNDGGRFGVRGYVSAYDAATGALAWRFHTAPGDPADDFESPAMETAADTWTGEWWAMGGGGAVWDAIVYDDVLDLLYVGVGAGAPWNHRLRSPEGGDNLFLSSIVALDPDDGSYVWHYQTTPGDTWDFDATQPIIIAELPIKGETRRVVMQAPNNGFFYVLDAQSGELISAQAYGPVNWAEGIDPATGRPIEVPEARWSDTGVAYLATPGPEGGHDWHPMSFSPRTGLVYIPVRETLHPFAPERDFTANPIGFNTGADFHLASLPQEPEAKAAALASITGALLAWDPVARREVWRAERPTPINGGVLATAGDLVFQGGGHGTFDAYRADDGEPLWSSQVQTGVIAAPASYEARGAQHVAVLVGGGGGAALAGGEATKAVGLPNRSRLLVYKLGGRASLPPARDRSPPPLDPPRSVASAAIVERGAKHYARLCGVCHGDGAVSGGPIVDLRRSATLRAPDAWYEVVMEGRLTDYGMPAFADVLDADGSEAVRAYIVARANEDKARETAP